jgi:glyoxylase-like metal-dependent hydrolase (beta-lactamase superfamily II)
MHGIHTIDCLYLDRPRFAAAYLIVDGDEAAFIDNNTGHAVPLLLAALKNAGLSPEQVRYLIVTHVHLDHAGGTSALRAACPNATILAHPRAARHIIDPSKLVASATRVYGEEQFERLYGVIEPIPAALVKEMGDEENLTLGQRTLTFLHTRGHANHHFCIADDKSNAVFTGDAFGLHYPDLQQRGTFAIPSTSPTDFDAELARQAIRRIEALAPDAVFPTHFGPVTDIAESAGQLIRHLDFAERVFEDAFSSDLPDEALENYVKPRLEDYFSGLFDCRGAPGSSSDAWDLVAMDIDLNAQGIAFAANKRRRKGREAEQSIG